MGGRGTAVSRRHKPTKQANQRFFTGDDAVPGPDRGDVVEGGSGRTYSGVCAAGQAIENPVLWAD
jgi:hypothetical protein